jgi:hypothetical protein
MAARRHRTISTAARAATRRVEIDALMGLVTEHADLFKSDGGEPHAHGRVGAHREVVPLASKTFGVWLDGLLFTATGKLPSAALRKQVLSLLEATARFRSPTRPVHLRVAAYGDAIILDLTDCQWRAVTIDVDGLRAQG